jgi:hypothetical protein
LPVPVGWSRNRPSPPPCRLDPRLAGPLELLEQEAEAVEETGAEAVRFERRRELFEGSHPAGEGETALSP